MTALQKIHDNTPKKSTGSENSPTTGKKLSGKNPKEKIKTIRSKINAFCTKVFPFQQIQIGLTGSAALSPPHLGPE